MPVSVTAFSADDMAKLEIKDFSDVVKFTPGAALTEGSNTISIRGIGSSSGVSTTGIYIDDTPIQERSLSIASQTLPSTFDLERIEVLKGPQGTLFGAGSEGGTVRYIMAQPDLIAPHVSARGETSYTQHGAPNAEVGIAGGTPVVDHELAWHGSVYASRSGGWIDRVDPNTYQSLDPHTNRNETLWSRFAATWAPTDTFSLTPSVIHQRRQTDDNPYIWDSLSSGSRLVSADPSRQPDDDHFTLASLKASFESGPVRVVSNTAYFNRKDVNSAYDGSLYLLSYYQSLGWAPDESTGAVGSLPYAQYQGSACPSLTACYPLLDGNGVHLPGSLQDYRAQELITQGQHSWSQELRVESIDTEPVSWTTGVFYNIERTTSLEQLRDPMVDSLFAGLFGQNLASVYGQPTNPDGSTYLPDGNVYSNSLRSTDRQVAVFANMSWSLTSTLRITGGIRWADTRFQIESLSDGPANFGALANSGSQKERPITKRLGVDFTPDPNSLIYASYSTGFRQGGANPPVPATVCDVDFANFGIKGAPLSYGSDGVKSYEIGEKIKWNDRVRVNSSVYYVTWDGIQQSVVLPNCALGYLANLGQAVSKGFDSEINVRLPRSVDLRLAVGYTDAHFSKTSLPGPDAALPIVSKGDAIVVAGAGVGGFAQPPNPWTFSAGLEKKWTAFGIPGSSRINYQYLTKNTRRSAAQNPANVQYDPYLGTPPALRLLSAQTSLQLGAWEVRVFGENLLNFAGPTGLGHTAVDGFGPQPPASPLSYYYTERPRTIGLGASYKY